MTTSDLLALKAATIAAATDLWQKAAWSFFFRLGELKGPVDPEVMNSRLIPNYRKCAHDLWVEIRKAYADSPS